MGQVFARPVPLICSYVSDAISERVNTPAEALCTPVAKPARAVSDKLNVMANPSSATTLKATTESNNREGQRGAEKDVSFIDWVEYLCIRRPVLTVAPFKGRKKSPGVLEM